MLLLDYLEERKLIVPQDGHEKCIISISSEKDVSVYVPWKIL